MDWFEALLEAETQQNSYYSTDNVIVVAYGEVTYHSGSITNSWETRYTVYNDRGQLLRSVYGFHLIAPWSDIDTALETKEINIGKLAYSQNVRVEVSARVPAYTGSWQHIRDIWIPVIIRESTVEPPSIPDNPEEEYPAPPPEPTPPPPDLPEPPETPEIPPEEDEEEEEKEESQFSWGWVAIGAAGVLALLAIVSSKNK